MISSRVFPARFVWIILFLAGACSARAQTVAGVNANPAIVQQAVQDGEKIWRAVRAEPSKDLASRDLFTYALALCEGQTHPERLVRLFTVAAQMQQRDPANRAYGNFRWSWGNADVVDFNAVDFCLQAGAVLWIRHRDTMRPEARALLATLLEHGVEGLRLDPHRDPQPDARDHPRQRAETHRSPERRHAHERRCRRSRE
eukprot:gene58817-80550_t